MGYCSTDDLKNTLPESQLIQLTDDNDTGFIDVEKIVEAIRKADDFVDGHLRGRYTLPLTTVPAMIRDLSIKLAIWFLFSRTLILTTPDSVKDVYKDTVSTLMKIQRGEVNPFPLQSDEPTFYTSNHTTQDQLLGGGGASDITKNWGAYLV